MFGEPAPLVAETRMADEEAEEWQQSGDLASAAVQARIKSSILRRGSGKKRVVLVNGVAAELKGVLCDCETKNKWRAMRACASVCVFVCVQAC